MMVSISLPSFGWDRPAVRHTFSSSDHGVSGGFDISGPSKRDSKDAALVRQIPAIVDSETDGSRCQ